MFVEREREREGERERIVGVHTKLTTWSLINKDLKKNQLDATYFFIVLLIGSTCFGHYYAHHRALTTIMLITRFVVPLCKDIGGSVNVKLWFLVVYVQCEDLCRLAVAGNVFLLILVVVILCVW